MSRRLTYIISAAAGAVIGVVTSLLINLVGVEPWIAALLFIFMFALWFGGQIFGFMQRP